MFGLLLAIFPTGKSFFFLVQNVNGLFGDDKYKCCALWVQCLCYYGFYIRKDSSTLFMTGGKIMFGLITAELDLWQGMIVMFTIIISIMI